MGTDAQDAHEAMLYEKQEGGACDCFLCAHRCHIAPGKRGFCRVRENRNGTLVSLVYGKVIAANADPIEKKPLYHFMPGTVSFSVATAGCNFRCDFCQNWQISQGGADHIPGDYLPPERIVQAAEERSCPSISYTYTEPTIFFEFAHDCAQLAQGRDIRNCFVTNGYMTPQTIEVMAGLIDAANVDLKAFTDSFYKERCAGRLEAVKESIRLMHEAGIHVEVTTLLIPGYNDDPAELRALTAFLAGVNADIPWHVSRYHPDYRFDHAPVTTPQAILQAIEIGREAGLKYIYAGNMHTGDFEDTLCPECGNVVIKRSAFSAKKINLSGNACGECGAVLPIVVTE